MPFYSLLRIDYVEKALNLLKKQYLPLQPRRYALKIKPLSNFYALDQKNSGIKELNTAQWRRYRFNLQFNLYIQYKRTKKGWITITMNCVKTFIENVKKPEEMCQADIFDRSHYQNNSYETWGGRLIRPLKTCLDGLDFPTKKTTWLDYVADTVINIALVIFGIIVTPFAYLGLCLRKKGESLNPGMNIRNQIITKRLELKKLTLEMEWSSPLDGVSKCLGNVSGGLTIFNKLIQHMRNSEDVKEKKAAEAYFSVSTTPFIAANLVERLLKNEEVKDTQFIKSWVIPMLSITKKGLEYTEGEFPNVEDEIKLILYFAQHIASEDKTWHEEIEAHLKSTIDVSKFKPALARLKAIGDEITGLVKDLNAIYAEKHKAPIYVPS